MCGINCAIKQSEKVKDHLMSENENILIFENKIKIEWLKNHVTGFPQNIVSVEHLGIVTKRKAELEYLAFLLKNDAKKVSILNICQKVRK